MDAKTKSNQAEPPKYAKRFLLWFLREELVEEVEGDLYEMFCYKLGNTTRTRAKLNYWYQVILYLRPFALINVQQIYPLHFAMYKTYLKIAFRHFAKNKFTYFINTMGLGISLACCICAYLFLAYNTEFDDFHDVQKMERVFKIHKHIETKTANRLESINSPIPLASEAAAELPGIEQYSRYIFDGGNIMTEEGNSFRERINFADRSFFDLFDFPFLSGTPKNFKDRSSIFLSYELAQKLFGDASAMGQVLTIHFQNNKKIDLTVGGILDKIPDNSSFVFEALVPFENYLDIYDLQGNDWSIKQEPSTFLKLVSNDMAPQLSEQLNKYLAVRNQAMKEVEVKAYQLEAFHSDFNDEAIGSGYVVLRNGPLPLLILGIMALMILLIACFNLTNTSIAMTGKRFKEIGVQKSVGAMRHQILGQFLAETWLTMIISLLIGLIFSYWIVAEFISLVNLNYGLEDLNGLNLFITLIILIFLAALIAGIYPALYNSRLHPTDLLKGSIKLKGTNWVNRILISSQFSLTVIFFIASIMFFQNIQFQENIDYGYPIDQIITLPIQEERQFEIIANDISTSTKVESVGATVSNIGSSWQSHVEIESQPYDVRVMDVGENFVETMGFELIKGRSLKTNSIYDKETALLVNEAFLEKTGMNDPFSQPLRFQETNRQIVGVINNHFENPDEAKMDEPYIFYLSDPADYQMMVVRTHAKDLTEVHSQLKRSWHKHFPNIPFESRYQHDIILKDLKYGNIVFGKIFLFLSLLGIILSISGIFSLASLNVARRIKEIGVRKVLGASMGNILALINREFALILCVSAIFGALGGAFLTETMLSAAFNYHISVGFSSVFLPALFICFLGLFVTSMTILKAASINPVQSLRTE